MRLKSPLKPVEFTKCEDGNHVVTVSATCRHLITGGWLGSSHAQTRINYPANAGVASGSCYFKNYLAFLGAGDLRFEFGSIHSLVALKLHQFIHKTSRVSNTGTSL